MSYSLIQTPPPLLLHFKSPKKEMRQGEGSAVATKKGGRETGEVTRLGYGAGIGS